MELSINDPIFRQAVTMIDAGQADELQSFLAQHPSLIHQRLHFEKAGYFENPSLLNFIAENPVRNGVLPTNIVSATRVLLETGARQDRSALNKTLELVASGRVPRECRVQVPLIDLLCDYGADPKSAVSVALVHGEFEAVEALVRRGAPRSLLVIAATGPDDQMAHLLPSSSPEQRQAALALAAQFGRTNVVRLLLDSGADPNQFSPPGCHVHSTPLHQAALNGHTETVKVLLENGAQTDIPDKIWNGAAAGWAAHGNHPELAELIRLHNS